MHNLYNKKGAVNLTDWKQGSIGLYEAMSVPYGYRWKRIQDVKKWDKSYALLRLSAIQILKLIQRIINYLIILHKVRT